ncbi:MAG TPA: selenocysteine-specific translation elongation factor [Anaerolineales bacterium]|nr:selenocysteine-specific translation elongation factor [Anaerolineales bacterium]
MRVIGTAGHVDHGKSTLVQALTGTHPDRLKEEREREMTIDLGFAFFDLPDGEEVGIVDVPGHRDFIENMLAGVGGIDAALFVVAADEGVMPQTREHLAILDLLQIPGGLIALTKTDLVRDPEWLDLVEEELRTAFRETVLARAPIRRVSARTGAGMPEFVSALAEILSERPRRPDLGLPRLPVDRAFTIAGFGTVVTGTLVDGHLRVGDEVEIMPAGLRARIRGLQSHNESEESIAPGSRAAVNLSGVRLEQAPRGSWLVRPGTYTATRRLDVELKLLPEAARPLKHNTQVKFFTGAAEVVARTRVLGVEQIDPGSTGWLQLELAEPVIARRGDRFILRRPSPAETIGGGAVLDPAPKFRHRRFNARLIARLESLSGGSSAQVAAEALRSRGEARLDQMRAAASLDAAEFEPVLRGLIEHGEVIVLSGDPANLTGETLLASRERWQDLSGKILTALESFHGGYPLRTGMPREELRSRLRIEVGLFNAAVNSLAGSGEIMAAGSTLARAGFSVRFSSEQARRAEALDHRLAADRFSPPVLAELKAEVGDDLVGALIDRGDLVLVEREMAFRKADYEEMVAAVREMIADAGALTVAGFRDRFGTSRKYALAVLEHFDAIGLTVRDGDVRRLKT